MNIVATRASIEPRLALDHSNRRRIQTSPILLGVVEILWNCAVVYSYRSHFSDQLH